jgi:hypothetical protein
MGEPLTGHDLGNLETRLEYLARLVDEPGSASYELHAIADRLLVEVHRLLARQTRARLMLGDRAHDGEVAP